MKKTLLVVLALVLVAALSVGLTMAFLTSQTDVVTNTFAVGNVTITLDESPVDEYGDVVAGPRVTENDYKLIPGHDYAKDPIIHVDADSENCWLFVKVVNGIEAIEEDGTTTIASQLAANGWTTVAPNVYAYENIVTGGNDVDVFETFKIKGNADIADYDGAEIIVIGYAVQADGFDTAAKAWAAAPATWKK